MKNLLTIAAVVVSFSVCMAADGGFTLPPQVILDKGWQAYKRGDMTEAERIFQFIKSRTTGDTRKQAEKGLNAITGRQQKTAVTAQTNISPAVDRLNAEFDAAAKEKDPAAVMRFLGAHNPPYRDRFLKKMSAEGWNRLNAGQYQPAEALFAQAKTSQDAQLSDNAAYGIAISKLKQGKNDEAAPALYSLFSAGYEKDDTAKALASAIPAGDKRRAELAAYFKDQFYKSDSQKSEYLKYYAMMSPGKETLNMADSLKPPFTAKEKADIDAARMTAAYAIMNSAPYGSAEYERGLNELLAARPGDKGGQEALSWLCLNRKQFACAENGFGTLSVKDPENENYQYGLASVYRETDRQDMALAITEKYSSPRMAAMRDGILSEKAAALYAENKYDETVKTIDSVKKPADSLLRLRAWALYKSGKKEEARAELTALYKKSPSQKSAEDMVSMSERDAKGMKACLAALREEDRKYAADTAAAVFAGAGQMIAAGQYAGKDSCYANAGKTIISAGYELSAKSGDSGTSKLTKQSAPVRAVVPIGGAWSAEVTEKYLHLDSGSAQDGIYAGKFYKYEDTGTQLRGLRTSEDLIESYAEFTREGDVFYTIGLGSTPAGGEADAVPVFKLSAKNEKFGLRFFRKSVGDSILSVSGLKDPYSDAVWGRVTDTGITGSYTFDLPKDLWLSAEASADSYQGKNTRQNSSVSIFAMLGRTFQEKDAENTLGLYASYRSFDNNQNHYTFGNGGYFSPQTETGAGLMAKRERMGCDTLWYRLSLAGGYQYYKEDASDIYSKTGSDVSSAADFDGRYASNSKSGLNVTAQAAVLKRISANFALGAYAKASAADQYNELAGGLVLTFTPSPRKSLAEYKDLLGRYVFDEWAR